MMGAVPMDVGGAGLLDAVSSVLLVGGVVLTLAAGAATIAVAVLVRRVRRSGVLGAASLRLHAVTDSGPRREVARLRLQLRGAVDGGAAAIRAGGASAGLAGEAPALFRRIRREALALDAHLKVMQTEDDHDTLRAAMPDLRRRVEEVVRLVRQLRAAVADGLAAVSADSLEQLGNDVEREVIALRAGRERLRHPDLPPRRPLTDEGPNR